MDMIGVGIYSLLRILKRNHILAKSKLNKEPFILFIEPDDDSRVIGLAHC